MLRAGEKGSGMNDYRKIRRHDTSRLQPIHTVMLHADSRRALTQFLAGGDRAKSVVITHHARSIKSLSSRKHEDLISAAYASNMEKLIIEQGPALWIHGHIHEVRDYVIGYTQVLNNALGYQTKHDPEETGFRRDLLVTLPGQKSRLRCAKFHPLSAVSTPLNWMKNFMKLFGFITSLFGAATTPATETKLVDPKSILFSTSPLNNAPPAFASHASPGQKLLRIHEDDWRQFEAISASFTDAIDQELNAIRNIHEAASVKTKG